MEKNKNVDLGLLEKLALIADSLQSLYSGKSIVLFEVTKEEYNSAISHFREIDRHHDRFTIEISGTDFVFTKIEEDKSNDTI